MGWGDRLHSGGEAPCRRRSLSCGDLAPPVRYGVGQVTTWSMASAGTVPYRPRLEHDDGDGGSLGIFVPATPAMIVAVGEEYASTR